jgi:hypothetical protein
MNVMLDGNALFDEQGLQIEIGSYSRARVERAICGLDGLLSIDLGKRTREIRQRGALRAPSRTAIQARIESISAFIDGGTHTLRIADGQEYHSIRMDSFRQIDMCTSGPGIVVEYEIMYTQLGV